MHVPPFHAACEPGYYHKPVSQILSSSQILLRQLARHGEGLNGLNGKLVLVQENAVQVKVQHVEYSGFKLSLEQVSS